MSNSIKGLLFDKDGTLFDFNATWGSWAAYFFKTLTANAEEAQSLGEKLGFDARTQEFDPQSVIVAGTTEEIANELGVHFTRHPKPRLIAMMNEAAQSAPQAETTPLRPFLLSLKPAYKLGVSTNDAEAPARAHLQAANIADLFDFIAGYDSGYGGKPEPGMQLAFCEALGLHPDEVAMIGDSTHDLIAGRAAGMRTIGVLTGLAKPADLSPYADDILPSIKDLPQWLSTQ